MKSSFLGLKFGPWVYFGWVGPPNLHHLPRVDLALESYLHFYSRHAVLEETLS